MKKYTIEIVIEEGCDEFWESLADKTGCDEVLEYIRTSLFYMSENVKLTKYEDIGN